MVEKKRTGNSLCDDVPTGMNILPGALSWYGGMLSVEIQLCGTNRLYSLGRSSLAARMEQQLRHESHHTELR